MLLETGGEARIPGAARRGDCAPPGSSDAELLILDGQQRLTTLTQVLATKDAVKTRTKANQLDVTTTGTSKWHLESGDRLEDAIEAIERGQDQTLQLRQADRS